MFTDPIADMLTRIRNAQARGNTTVVSRSSKMCDSVLRVLQSEGYIRGFTTNDLGSGKAETIIELKYYDGKPVIKEVQRVSKPGRKVYSSIAKMPQVAGGLGTILVSTSRGVMSDAQARREGIGGELICKVF